MNRRHSTADEAFAGYAMTYFAESPSGNADSYNLHLAVSEDGLNWTPLNQNNPVATPTLGAGGLRDPYVLRKQDGTFVVMATDLKGTDWSRESQYIHVWDSTDLRSFTGYRLLQLHDLASHSWAPEAFWDAGRGEYAILYSATPDSYNVIMVNYTSDFRTASEPQVFHDPGEDTIDGSLLSANGVNYLYVKSQTDCTMLGTRSRSLNPGSFSSYTDAITPGRGIEAPELIKANNADTWYLWGDTWSPNGRFFCWETSNPDTASWAALSDRAYTQPLNSKHCGITAITATELSDLTAHWGEPAWHRLKSYNFPDRYVRHHDHAGRIDAYPFDPYQDQLWTVLPGLADPAGISLRSVNHPDRYLRHADYQLVLDPNDGTTTFAADATFHRMAGFADVGWTFLRSHNFPDRYVRHANYQLRVDPISHSAPDADKQDATFSFCY